MYLSILLHWYLLQMMAIYAEQLLYNTRSVKVNSNYNTSVYHRDFSFTNVHLRMFGFLNLDIFW